MFSALRPKSCFGLRCRMVTSCPSFSNSSTSSLPMKRVPPITNTLIGFSARLSAIPRRALSGGTRFLQKIQRLIVIFQAQVRDEIFTLHPAQRIFELHQLDEN